MAASLMAVVLVRALLLASQCQFFLTDREGRQLLTNQTSRMDALDSPILTRNELLGSNEEARLDLIKQTFETRRQWASKLSSMVNPLLPSTLLESSSCANRPLSSFHLSLYRLFRRPKKGSKARAERAPSSTTESAQSHAEH
jgi:hypothetical protein